MCNLRPACSIRIYNTRMLTRYVITPMYYYYYYLKWFRLHLLSSLVEI